MTRTTAARRFPQDRRPLDFNHPFPAPMDDKKILALARKNAAKSIAQNKPRAKAYDATVEATRPVAPDDTSEADRIFKEMKRREF
ncbi:MAG TPA: hypothetical protein VFW04_14440 [Gemmatimonadaceae bacterium]|nr:hypothetical protein [Gemmatimonadaceae bacterium]